MEKSTKEVLRALEDEYTALSERASAVLRELRIANVCLGPGPVKVLETRAFNGHAAASALRTARIHIRTALEVGTFEDHQEAERLDTLAVLKAKARARRERVSLEVLDRRLAS